MDPIIGGALIGAGSSLLGGLINSGAQASANAQNAAMMRQQYEWQKEFAQQGIRWKVGDAKAAGIHPLFALGGSTASYSPSSMQVGVDPMGSSLANMGQDIGRAVAATKTAPERAVSDFEKARQVQMLEHGALQNDALRMQIASQSARLSASQIGPPLPASTGSVSSAAQGVFEAKPPEVLNAQPSQPSATAGPSQPSTRWERNPDGSVVALPTANMDDFSSPGYLNYQYQNRILPFFNGQGKPPDHMLPPGATGWRFQFPGAWAPVFPSIPDGRHYIHHAPPGRRGKAQPRVILNP